MKVSRWPVLACSLVVLAVGGLAGCTQVRSGLEQIAGGGAGRIAGADCVDSQGPNSTPDQIVDAALSTPVTDPVTGETKTMLELGQQSAAQLNNMLPGLELDGSPKGFRDQYLDDLWKDVPEGGDAAYAAAVCTMRSGWPKIDILLSWQEAKAAATPHVLRSSGRNVCTLVRSGDMPAESLLAQERLYVVLGKNDPEQLKAKSIADLDQSIAALSNVPAESPLRADLEAQRQARAQLVSTSARDVAESLEATHRIKWLAIEHQCPDLSIQGFGPTCGTIEYESGESGVIKLYSDTRSCPEARAIVTDHINNPTMNPNPGAGTYVCHTDLEMSEENPAYTTCRIPSGGHEQLADRISVVPSKLAWE